MRRVCAPSSPSWRDSSIFAMGVEDGFGAVDKTVHKKIAALL
jgi:hypothetical protein